MDVDLRGLRLNVLRIAIGLSTPSVYKQVQGAAGGGGLLRELTAAAALSSAIDATDAMIAAVTDVPALKAGGRNLTKLFTEALETAPIDCLFLLRIAATSTTPTASVPPLLQLLTARLFRLLRGLIDHHLIMRREPHSPQPSDVMYQITTLVAALDGAAPLEYGSSRLSFQEWLREQTELFIDMQLPVSLSDCF